MSQQIWTAVDTYFSDLLITKDTILDEVLAANVTAGLPAHDVSPTQGKLLQLFVQMTGAKNILEIGTLGGYSTIWMARALPLGGKLVTLEAKPVHAAVAQQNIDRAGLTEIVDIRIGAAAETLPLLEGSVFDLVFIDADKPNNPVYLEWALKLVRPGSIIIGDNVVRDGAVADANSTDANVKGVRSFMDMISANKKLSATAIQTVGSKGYDGFVIARVL